LQASCSTLTHGLTSAGADYCNVASQVEGSADRIAELIGALTLFISRIY